MSPSHRGRLLLEMASIVFAVVLGFAVSNWDVARRDRARAEAAMDRMRLELEADRAELEAVAPYYAAMAQRIDSLVREDGDRPIREATIPGWRGLSPPSLRTASFRLATETGALEHVAFDVADEVAVTYEVLEDLSSSVDHALGAVMAGNLTSLTDWRVVFGLFAEVSFDALARTRTALEVLSGETGTEEAGAEPPADPAGG